MKPTPIIDMFSGTGELAVAVARARLPHDRLLRRGLGGRGPHRRERIVLQRGRASIDGRELR